MTNFAIDPNGPLGYLVEKQVPKGPDNKLGKDAFLKLLVAQMKYQNPMEPADATDFIAQTAQFTLVEQMENMASANEEMLAGQRNATAASMVGQRVKWTVDGSDEEGSPGEGTVQGVRITADGPILIVDGWDVPMSRVTAFGQVAPAEDTASDGTTSGAPTAPTAPAAEVAPVDDAATAPEDTEVVEETTEVIDPEPVAADEPAAPDTTAPVVTDDLTTEPVTDDGTSDTNELSTAPAA